MSFKIKGNDPLCEPPPLISLLNEREKVTEGKAKRFGAEDGKGHQPHQGR